MSANDMEQPSGAFNSKMFAHRDKSRDGRHGPVFCVADGETCTLMAGERLELEGPALEKAISRLQQRPRSEHNISGHHTTVAYLGYHREGSQTYLLTDTIVGHTIVQAIRDIGRALSLNHACELLRGIIRGLEKLYMDEGLTVVFLDANQIWLPMNGTPRIEGPILDITVTGQPFLPSVLTLPEIALGPGRGGNLRKADVWLLGIVAAIMLSGRLDLVADYAAATAVGAQIIKQGPTGSALAILLPDHEFLSDNPLALDFLRKCFIINSDERPSIAELRDHPFLAVAESGKAEVQTRGSDIGTGCQ